MNQVNDYLPITAIFALLIFLFKEFLEWYRRCRAESRRLHVMKHMIAREVEKADFVLKRLKIAFENVDEIQKDMTRDIQYVIEKNSRGDYYYRSFLNDEKNTLQYMWLPSVEVDNFGKYLEAAALIDKELMENVEAVYDDLLQIESIFFHLLIPRKLILLQKMIGWKVS